MGVGCENQKLLGKVGKITGEIEENGKLKEINEVEEMTHGKTA